MTAIQIAPVKPVAPDFLSNPKVIKIGIGIMAILFGTAAFPLTNGQKAHPAELPQTFNNAEAPVELTVEAPAMDTAPDFVRQ